MQTSETPVLVVEGGSAGTTLSLELARRGVEAAEGLERHVESFLIPLGSVKEGSEPFS